MLARHLPRESSLVREIAGEPADWSLTDYLLAAVVDGVNYLLWAYVSAHSKTRPRRPEEVRRPALPQDNRRTPKPMATGNEIAAFFATLKGGA